MASIGSDPEVLVSDAATGRMLSCAGHLGGSKGKAIPMDGLPEGFGIQEDNVMLEFNIPPAYSAREFDSHISTALEYVDGLVRSTFVQGADVHKQCSMVYGMDQLESAKAQEFGCSADFDAHQQGVALRPFTPDILTHPDGQWRFAGGHIHLGYLNPAGVPEFVVAALADYYIGLRSIGLDAQGERRKYYGSAGRYRPTSYGIEYRSLSNFWLFDAATTRAVGEQAMMLATLIESGNETVIRALYTDIPWADVQRAINTENAELAADLCAFVEDEIEEV